MKIILLSTFRGGGAEVLVEELQSLDHEFTILSGGKWLFPFWAPIVTWFLKPDIVHANLETFAGLAMCFCPGKKVLTCQTTNRRFLKGFIVRRADKVIVLSKHLRDIARKFGVESEVIPNGIHLENFREARRRWDKERRVLFVGRLEYMKGVDTLLQYKGKIRIAGDGSQREYLESIAGENVTFLGRVSREELYKEYAEAEVFCGLSRSEAFGNVFLEAKAAGCKVIGTDVGGILADVYIKPNTDPTEAIEYCFSRDFPQKDLHEYDWKNIVQKYDSIYKGRNV